MSSLKEMLNTISVKAVIFGAIADNATTLFIMSVLAAALVSTGLSETEVMDRMKSTNGLLLGIIIGLGCTVLGGYIAGRVAGKAEHVHGVLVAVIGMVIAAIFWDSKGPLWFDIVGFAGMLPAGVFGGHLSVKQPKSIDM